jgi:chromosome segregation ATPase
MTFLGKGILFIRVWQRNRELRRQLRAAQDARAACESQLAQCTRRIAELEAEPQRLRAAHKGEIAQLKEQIGKSESRAAAEHYSAFKWGHNYKVMELDLNATRTERDLAYEHARKLAARVEELEAELGKALR